jgi:flagellar assembly protein FliH
MPARLQLEVFEAAAERQAGGATVVLDSGDLEETRLAAYDEGYKAGWDDAVAAQDGDASQTRSEVARNLQALSFTYHEARTHVLRALQPLLVDLVGQLLPQIARDSLPYHLAETLMPLAEQAAEAPVTLLVNAGTRGAVEALLASRAGLPVTIVEEPTLGDGQAWLQLGEIETRIDLDAAAADLRALLSDFFSLNAKEPRHG